MTVAAMAVVGCSTEDQRIANPNSHQQNSSTNTYNPGAQDNSNPAHYGPGGYSSVGPDGTAVPNPSAVNPLDPQSDSSILRK